MARVRFVSTRILQYVGHDGLLVSWHGEVGEDQDVPDEAAAYLLGEGIAEKVTQSVSEAASRLSEEKANNDEASEAGRVLESARKKPPAKPNTRRRRK